MRLIQKVSNWVMDFKISTKIRLLYLGLLVISVLISAILYQRVYLNVVSARISSSSMETLYSINQNITILLDNVNTYSKIILANADVQDSLRRGNLSTDQAAAASLNKNLHAFIEAVPVISSIYIIDMNSQKYVLDKNQTKQFDLKSISAAPWYGAVMKKNGGYILSLNGGGTIIDKTRKNFVSLIRVIDDVYTQKPLGILVMNISEKNFQNAYQMVVNQNGTQILLLDEKDENIVNVDKMAGFDQKRVIEKLGELNQNTSVEKIGSKEHLVSCLKIKKLGWKIISVIPLYGLLKDAQTINWIALLIVLLNALLLFIGSLFIARMVTNPINKLLKAMKGIENGQFEKVDIRAGKNEIGMLRDGYNMTVSKLETLFDKVVEEQKNKRKYELKALQAQIKPHFLYNTFDAISYLALAGRTREVYEIMMALGSYYRTSLSKGNEIIDLSQEIEVVKNYLKIQKVRYGDLFQDFYEIDERAAMLKIPKLVLQPLVENAIYHGIKPKGESGEIRISAAIQDGFVHLAVADDGVGMSEETLKSIQQEELGSNDASFGFRGTIERLRIFYNTPHIYTIESRKGEGTRVTLHIPTEGGLGNEHGLTQDHDRG